MSNTIQLTRSEASTLIKAVTIQYDIAGDTVTDDLSISEDTAISAAQLADIRKSTSYRIDILVLLTHVLAVLNTAVGVIELTLSDEDRDIFRNELSCYLSMIEDMVEEDDGTLLLNRIQHIVNINLVIVKI